MKKFLFYVLILSVLVLAACGETEDTSSEENSTATGESTNEMSEQPTSESMSREEYEEDNAPGMADMPTENRDFSTATEDVLEFIDYNDTDIFVDGPHDYLILERYEMPEAHESGRNRIDFNGFKQEFGLFLVEDEFGYKHIFYGGEHMNDTEETIDYNGTMTYVTDTGEQFSPEYGLPGAMHNDLIMSYEPGVKKVDFTLAALENQEEVPDEVRIMFGGLYRITETGVDIENMWTEDTEFTFYRK